MIPLMEIVSDLFDRCARPVAALTVALVTPAVLDAATPPRGNLGDIAGWRLVYTRSLPATVSTLFCWSSETFTAIDPTTGVVHSLESKPDAKPALVLQLGDRRTPVQELFPDPVRRDARGRLHWLQRDRAEVVTFGAEGNLLHVVPLSIQPFWFDIEEGGDTVWVSGTRCESGASVYQHYESAEAAAMNETPGWLTGRLSPGAGQLFFFRGDGGRRFEVLAHFPFSRVTGPGDEERPIDLSSALLHRRLRYVRARPGRLPAPIGRGDGEVSVLYAVSAARRSSSAFFVLVNGGRVVSVDVRGERGVARTFGVPTVVRGAVDEINTSIAASEKRLAILTRHAGQVTARIWEITR